MKDIEKDIQTRREGLDRRQWYRGEDLSWRDGGGGALDGRGGYGALGPVPSPSTAISESGLSQQRQLTLQERNAGQLEKDLEARRRALQQKQWYQGEDLSWRGGGAAGGKKDAYTELMGWAKGKEAQRLHQNEERLLSLGLEDAAVGDGAPTSEKPAMAESGVQARRTSINRATGAAPPVVGLPGAAAAAPAGMATYANAPPGFYQMVPYGMVPVGGTETRSKRSSGRRGRGKGDEPRQGKSRRHSRQSSEVPTPAAAETAPPPAPSQALGGDPAAQPLQTPNTAAQVVSPPARAAASSGIQIKRVRRSDRGGAPVPTPAAAPPPPMPMPPPGTTPGSYAPPPRPTNSVGYHTPYSSDYRLPLDLPGGGGLERPRKDVEMEVFKVMNATWAKREDELQKYLESEVARLRGANDALERERKSLIDENANLRQGNSSAETLRERLEKEMKEGAKLREQNGRLQGLNAVLTEEVKQLHDNVDVSTFNPQIDTLRDMNQKLRDSNKELLETKQEYEATEQDLLTEIEELREKVKLLDVPAEAANLLEENKTLKVQLQEKEAENETLREAVAQLEGMVDDHGQLELEVAETRYEAARMKNDLDALRQENVTLSASKDNKGLVSEVHNLRGEVKALSHALQSPTLARTPSQAARTDATPTGGGAESASGAARLTHSLVKRGASAERNLASVDYYRSQTKPKMDYLRLFRNESASRLAEGGSILFSDFVFRRSGDHLEKLMFVVTARNVYMLHPATYEWTWMCPLVDLGSVSWASKVPENLVFDGGASGSFGIQTPRRDAIIGVLSLALETAGKSASIDAQPGDAGFTMTL